VVSRNENFVIFGVWHDLSIANKFVIQTVLQKTLWKCPINNPNPEPIPDPKQKRQLNKGL